MTDRQTDIQTDDRQTDIQTVNIISSAQMYWDNQVSQHDTLPKATKGCYLTVGECPSPTVKHQTLLHYHITVKQNDGR